MEEQGDAADLQLWTSRGSGPPAASEVKPPAWAAGQGHGHGQQPAGEGVWELEAQEAQRMPS